MSASGHRPSLTVVVPCFDEEKVVERFHGELARALAQIETVEARILFVDDGSRDRTLEVLNGIAARHPEVDVLSLSRNFGHQIALTAGLDATEDADAVVVMDADLQHPPDVIRALVERYLAGDDVVMAVREETEEATLFKRISSKAFYRVFNLLSDVTLREGAADFYLLSRRAREALGAMPERRRFLRGMVTWIGFPRSFVSYVAAPRAGGRSKYTLFRMLRLAADGVLAFSSKPIQLASRTGILVAALGMAYLAYVLVRHFVFGDLVEGWGSLISVVLILGGIQLCFIGLIGEYVARIFDESKGRPLYLVKQRSARHAVAERLPRELGREGRAPERAAPRGPTR